MNVISKLRWSDWLGLGMIAVSIVLSSVVGDQFSLFLIIGIAVLVSRWIFLWTDRIGWGRHGEGWVNRMSFWMFLFGMGLYSFAQVWYKGDNILVDFFATWVFYLLASVALFISGLFKGPYGWLRGWHLASLVGVVGFIFTLLLSGALNGILATAFYCGIFILFAWGALAALNDDSPPVTSPGGSGSRGPQPSGGLGPGASSGGGRGGGRGR